MRPELGPNLQVVAVKSVAEYWGLEYWVVESLVAETECLAIASPVSELSGFVAQHQEVA